jgi:hypothetical protein
VEEERLGVPGCPGLANAVAWTERLYGLVPGRKETRRPKLTHDLEDLRGYGLPRLSPHCTHVQ